MQIVLLMPSSIILLPLAALYLPLPSLLWRALLFVWLCPAMYGVWVAIEQGVQRTVYRNMRLGWQTAPPTW